MIPENPSTSLTVWKRLFNRLKQGQHGYLIITILTLPYLYLTSYYLVFSNFITIDDEGYFSLSLRYKHADILPYDSFSYIYGPVFFMVYDFYHWLGLIEFSFESLRMPLVVHNSIIIAVYGILTASLVRGTFNRIAVYLTGMLLVLMFSRDTFFYPLHPQDLGSLLLLCLLFVYPRVPVIAFVVIAAIICALAVGLKINLGVFFVLICIATILPVRKYLALILVIPLLAVAYKNPLWLSYFLPGLYGIAAIYLCRSNETRWYHPVLLLIGFAASILLVYGFSSLYIGVDARAILYQTLFKVANFTDAKLGGGIHWQGIGDVIAVCSTIGSGIALIFYQWEKHKSRALRIAEVVFILLNIMAWLFLATKTMGMLSKTMSVTWIDDTNIAIIYLTLAPWIWVSFLRFAKDDVRSRQWLILLNAACLYPMIAYPVPGNQIAIGSIPLIMVLLVSLYLYWRKAWNAVEKLKIATWVNVITNVILIVMVSAIASAFLYKTRARYHQNYAYDGRTDSRTRLALNKVKQISFLVENTRGVDDHVSLDGQNSIFTMTDTLPEYRLLISDTWPFLSDYHEQIKVHFASLERYVIIRDVTDPAQALDQNIFFQWIALNTRPVAQWSIYELRLPNSSDQMIRWGAFQFENDEQSYLIVKDPRGFDTAESIKLNSNVVVDEFINATHDMIIIPRHLLPENEDWHHVEIVRTDQSGTYVLYYPVIRNYDIEAVHDGIEHNITGTPLSP